MTGRSHQDHVALLEGDVPGDVRDHVVWPPDRLFADVGLLDDEAVDIGPKRLLEQVDAAHDPGKRHCRLVRDAPVVSDLLANRRDRHMGRAIGRASTAASTSRICACARTPPSWPGEFVTASWRRTVCDFRPSVADRNSSIPSPTYEFGKGDGRRKLARTIRSIFDLDQWSRQVTG